MAYIKRAAEEMIVKVAQMFPVLLVTGPRQVGKTTLLQRVAEAQKEKGIERKYVTLDDPDARYLAKHDPALFLQRYSPPVLIDEIQYATELFPYIKMSADHSKQKGDFWLTGAQVADEMQFYNFMTIVAAHTSKPVVYEELAGMAGISAPTAKKWMSILLSSHIIALVQPYHNNVLKRVVKMPLLHFLDTGLASYLLKWGNPEALERGAMSGNIFESYVFSEIYKSYLNAGKEPPIFYYRDKDQKEIDLLIYQNGELSPIEIKKAASPGRTAVKNFHVLDPVNAEEAFGGLESLKVEIGTGNVICMASALLPVDEKNWYVPVWLI